MLRYQITWIMKKHVNAEYDQKQDTCVHVPNFLKQKEFIFCCSLSSVYLNFKDLHLHTDMYRYTQAYPQHHILSPHTHTHTQATFSDVTFIACRLAFNYRPVSGPSSPVAVRPWAPLSPACVQSIFHYILHIGSSVQHKAALTSSLLWGKTHTQVDASFTKSLTAVRNGFSWLIP